VEEVWTKEHLLKAEAREPLEAVVLVRWSSMDMFRQLVQAEDELRHLPEAVGQIKSPTVEDV
jgi:hypothetical protein